MGVVVIHHKVTKNTKATKMKERDGMESQPVPDRSWVQERFAHADLLTHAIIGAAIAVHRQLGPGLLECVYHECMQLELRTRGIDFESEVCVPSTYGDTVLTSELRLDLLVGGMIVVELKAVEKVLPVHQAQLLTYMKLAEKPIGLLINFNSTLLKEGIHRRVL